MSKQVLTVTEKYVWKSKENFFIDSNQIDEYFQIKKENLFKEFNLPISENSTSHLLSSLPKPTHMLDIQKASQRILNAIQLKEKITIFGDYDVDGTTSCAMLFLFFQEIGYPVDIYIPDRLTEGYGLNAVGVQKLAQAGTKLIITVDNGIAAVSACEVALNLNIDVIITDHHDIPPQLPTAYAILNPKQSNCTFPFKMLAGVGVAFYLMISLRALMRESGLSKNLPNLKNYLDFVAIGTIADMAPLNGVNHILCKLGLEVLTTNLICGMRPGLYQLLKLSGWNGLNKVTATDIGFKIGPRLNAAGRLGNALRSVDILTTKVIQDAENIAQFLHMENSERQQMEKKFTLEAMELVAEKMPNIPSALVLHKEHWHSGVVGLVASRVLEKYYRPSLVFGTLDGKLKGSGRSTHSFNLFEALNAVRHEFISFGGHFHAVGLTLAPEKLPWLTNYLEQKAQELILQVDKTPPLFIDGKLPLHALDKGLMTKLDDFEPYGIANPRSKWLIGPLQIKHIRRIGKDVSQSHAKILFLEYKKEFWLTGFGMADAFEQMLSNGLDVQVVVEIKRNYWNEREYVDLSIVDFAPVVYLNQ